MEALKCDWNRNGKHCAGTARYLCGNSHVLCARHAVALEGSRRRRSTDRECLLCLSRDVIDFLKQAADYAKHRRATDLGSALSETA